MKINKAVITAAGLGTRLLPATKETPKEMLPLFAKENGRVCLKPLLQIVFEQLFDFGVREFCFIVGRGKRSIEDHFSPDKAFTQELKSRSKHEHAENLERFYSMVRDCDITWKNQLSPKGFGDAVSLTENFVGQDPFLVYTGDTYIISEGNDFLYRLVTVHVNNNSEATLICEKVQHPERFGVIVATEISKGNYKVQRILEKPEKPPSNLVAAAIYLFNPTIFNALEEIPYISGEKELTNAIQRLVEQEKRVYAVELKTEEERLDIGTVNSYKLALDKSYDWSNPMNQ